jgi:hypothetical protein
LKGSAHPASLSKFAVEAEPGKGVKAIPILLGTQAIASS